MVIGPLQLEAQVVTSSFAPDSVGDNPAAAATRQWGIAGGFLSMNKTVSKFPFGEGGTTSELTRTVETQHNEIIVGWSKKFIVPEFYMDYATGRRVDKFGEGSPAMDLTLLNGQANVGVDLHKYIKVGVQAVNTANKSTTKSSYSFGDFTSTNEYSEDTSILGLGIGSTLLLGDRFSIGYYTLTVTADQKFNYKSKFNDEQESTFSGQGKVSATKQGVGIAYQNGNMRTKAIRVEVSAAKMGNLAGGQTDFKSESEQFSGTIELAYIGLVGGMAVRSTKGPFINFRKYLDFILEEASNTEAELSYSFFLGFRTTKGHTFGLKAFSFTGQQKVVVNQKKFDAEVSTLSGGVSYSYIF
jgi:hypothetical protein